MTMRVFTGRTGPVQPGKITKAAIIGSFYRFVASVLVIRIAAETMAPRVSEIIQITGPVKVLFSP